jgi:restriction endonuclease S subunit
MSTRHEGSIRDEIGPIPEGWNVVKFGTVRKWLQYGTSIRCSYEPSGYPVLRIPNIEPGQVSANDLKYGRLNASEARRYCLEKGDIIFIRTNGVIERLGSCAVYEGTPENALFASYLIRARLKLDRVDPHFVTYFFASPRGNGIVAARATPAADGKYNLNTATIDGFPLPLPPTLDEQRAIAAALALVREAISLHDKSTAHVLELKRAAMRALFTRGLNGEAQKETEIGPIPEGWTPMPIVEVGAVKGGKRMPKGVSLVQEDTGRPYVRVTDLENHSVRSDGILFVPKGYEGAIQRYRISAQDVYISIAGSIGLVGQVPAHLDDANLTENAAKIVFDREDVAARYVMYALAGHACQDQIARATAKNAQPKLALTRIERILVPLPPTLEEQLEVVSILDTIDLKIDFHRRKRTVLDELFKTLLHKLMTGEIRVGDLDLGTLPGAEEAAA